MQSLFEPSQPKKKRISKLIVVTVSIVIMLFSAAAVVGVSIYVKNSTQQPATPSDTTAKITGNLPDVSKDYGACSLVTKDKIKSAIGKTASTVQEPVNNGIVGVNLIGDKISNFSADAQSCLYHFAPVSQTARYTNDNGLTVQLTKFSNSESTAAYLKQIMTNPNAVAIDTIGDDALYTYSVPGEILIFYSLHVFKANELYEYTLYLPTSTTLDSTAAQQALTTLAQG